LAKYLFGLYSMTLQTFSYVVPASGNLLSKGWVHHPSDEQCSDSLKTRYTHYKMYVKFPGKLVTCISYENYVYRTKSDW
jgi:hypothetical protein